MRENGKYLVEFFRPDGRVETVVVKAETPLEAKESFKRNFKDCRPMRVADTGVRE